MISVASISCNSSTAFLPQEIFREKLHLIPLSPTTTIVPSSTTPSCFPAGRGAPSPRPSFSFANMAKRRAPPSGYPGALDPNDPWSFLRHPAVTDLLPYLYGPRIQGETLARLRVLFSRAQEVVVSFNRCLIFLSMANLPTSLSAIFAKRFLSRSPFLSTSNFSSTR